jgi:predicted Zn-dependent protease
MAFAAKGDLVKARTEQGAFETARSKLPVVALNNNQVADVMNVASHLLAGRVAQAAGEQATAIKAYRAGVEAQDNLIYDEPPAFPWPIREHLGSALLASGDAKAAEEVFAKDLVKHPKNPRSLLGLSQAQAAQGKRAEAKRSHREFMQAAKHADITLERGSFSLAD